MAAQEPTFDDTYDNFDDTYVNFLGADLDTVAPRVGLEKGWLPIASQEDLNRAFGSYRIDFGPGPTNVSGAPIDGPKFKGRVRKSDPDILSLDYCTPQGESLPYWPNDLMDFVKAEATQVQESSTKLRFLASETTMSGLTARYAPKTKEFTEPVFQFKRTAVEAKSANKT